MKFYDALGLEPKLALDLDDLKKRFYDRSRQWHPDRFSRGTSEEKQRSEEMTSMLNDAFRSLRDQQRTVTGNALRARARERTSCHAS